MSGYSRPDAVFTAGSSGVKVDPYDPAFRSFGTAEGDETKQISPLDALKKVLASFSDQVEFRVAGHAGASLRPVGKVASGGELSRIGLAIAVLAAQANPVPTLIFDEADAGVGGAVAEVIGALMRRLGGDRQVLCVTHLPQVAAQAHAQVRVVKAESGGRTVSRLLVLDRAGRVEEIARMLGGVSITATTRRHARELLAP